MKDGNWIPLDKMLIKYLPKDRSYTVLEAYFSLRYDVEEGKNYTINGYAQLWGWDRKKVRTFVDGMMSGKAVRLGHLKDTKGPGKGSLIPHDIRFIFNNLGAQKDTISPQSPHNLPTISPTTINPNKNIKPKPSIYSADFETFWQEYPRGDGKGKAWESWQKIKPPVVAVLSALTWQKVSDQWTKENGQFIPHAATYLNQRRWEDKPSGPRILTEKEKYDQQVQAAL